MAHVDPSIVQLAGKLMLTALSVAPAVLVVDPEFVAALRRHCLARAKAVQQSPRTAWLLDQETPSGPAQLH
jgi:hypothetical protein